MPQAPAKANPTGLKVFVAQAWRRADPMAAAILRGLSGHSLGHESRDRGNVLDFLRGAYEDCIWSVRSNEIEQG
jgi:hypothetical protein